MTSWADFLLFQVGWFASVLGAAQGAPWLGPLFTVTWMSFHLKCVGDRKGAELRLLAAAGLLGWVSDSILLSTGWIDFPPETRFGLWSPLWMVVLWINLAATLRGVMSWLRERYLLAAFLGSIAGPLAYWSGSRLGAMELLSFKTALLAIAVEWCLGMPLLLVLEKWSFDHPSDLPAQEAAANKRSQ
jgi:hypothetical protein